MSKRGEPRGTTGRYSAKTPGLPNADTKRADARLRRFDLPDDQKPNLEPHNHRHREG